MPLWKSAPRCCLRSTTNGRSELRCHDRELTPELVKADFLLQFIALDTAARAYSLATKAE